MKKIILSATVIAAFSAAAMASLPFHDDFESGMGNWQMWPGAAETLQLAADPWKSIDPGPVGVGDGHSARAYAYVGGGNGYSSYHDFGPQTGPIRAEVYMFEDYTSTMDPIWGGIHLLGANNGNVGNGTEYLRLGIMQWAGTNTYYTAATKQQGWLNTNQSSATARKAGFTKLAIEADGVGQQVRFFIDDTLVYTGVQSAPLQYVALGFSHSNYENFWYDGVRVTPEPASAALLLIGLGLIARKRRA